MTNSIIKKPIDKGLLRAKQITPKNIHYLLTPDGISMVSRRGSDFLKRTVRNVVVFNQSIEIIVKDAKEQGYKTINLIGESDLLFLIQHSCNVNGIELKQSEEESTDSRIKNIDSAELGQELLNSYLVEAVLH